jgi:hypothetical protein
VNQDPGARRAARFARLSRGALRVIRTSIVTASAVVAILVTDAAGPALALAATTEPQVTSEAGVSRWVRGGELVGAFGVTLGSYLAGIALLARLRDPLRGRRGRPLSESPVEPGNGDVVDVTGRAATRRRAAVLRQGLQLAGLAVASPVLVPFLWPESLPYAGLGLLIGMGAPWWIQRRRGEPITRGVGRTVIDRPIVATAVFLLAAAAILLGVASFVAFAVESVIQSVANRASQIVVYVFGVVAMATGSALWLLGQRLASARAPKVLRQDPRPPVLYLRSIGDDGLKLRVATYGRAAAIERLSPRRFAPFEQIIARHLVDVGPVIAVNPPGTRLAPLGAARETLSDHAWQDTIDERIRGPSWKVVCAPPRELSRGFAWELGQLSAQGWRRTVFVLPPVPDSEMRQRWDVFAAAFDQGSPVRPLPVDPALALAATLRPDGAWTVFVADRRDEWSYAVALEAACGSDASDPADR